MFYGLSKQQTKELAYKYAMELEKNVSNIWTLNEAAGEDWLKGFRRRHSSITLRKPEATSRARASAFNQYYVGEFFNNLKLVLSRNEGEPISPRNIFNINETGLSTVQKPGQILAECGIKQVGRITSGERGKNITMCACVSAAGISLPHTFIFPRVNFRPHVLKGAPIESFGLANSSGWITNQLFPKV